MKGWIKISTYKEIKDIVIGKLVDKTIDTDYEDLSEAIFGEGNCYSSTETRKRMYGMKALIDVIERDKELLIEEQDLLDELARKKAELKIERQKLIDEKAAYNCMIRGRARQEELNEIITEAVKNGDLKPLNYSHAEIAESDNSLLISLNDIHYGAEVNNHWRKYNVDICCNMFNHYLGNIVNIAKTHNSEDCYVWANGDFISGSIKYSISVSNQKNVIDQIKGVSELIAEFLANLSRYFKTVSFVSVAGNHSRLSPNKEQTIKDERLDDLVQWYLEARLQNFPNIIFSNGNIIDETMYTMDVRGKLYCGVHGDYDGSKNSVQSIQSMVGEPLYAILFGHLHHNQTDMVQGIKTIMAGSFVGMDDYCVEKRIVGLPEQMVCVCDSEGIKCMYDIKL